MPGRRRPRCSDCHGSGRCLECEGTGVNLHLNQPEPNCRGCHGTGKCSSCLGTGLPTPTGEAPRMPIGLRAVLSVMPCLILYKVVLAGEPVHFGRGGPIVPRVVAALVTVGIGLPLLCSLWKGVKRDDFRFPDRDERTSLFGNCRAAQDGRESPGASAHRQ